MEPLNSRPPLSNDRPGLARRALPALRAVLAAYVAISPAIVWACPGCSEALFDPTQAAATAGTLRGYLVSIVVLLGLPVLMIGGIALALRRASRARRLTASGLGGTLPPHTSTPTGGRA